VPVDGRSGEVHEDLRELLADTARTNSTLGSRANVPCRSAMLPAFSTCTKLTPAFRSSVVDTAVPAAKTPMALITPAETLCSAGRESGMTCPIRPARSRTESLQAGRTLQCFRDLWRAKGRGGRRPLRPLRRPGIRRYTRTGRRAAAGYISWLRYHAVPHRGSSRDRSPDRCTTRMRRTDPSKGYTRRNNEWRGWESAHK
jgi:hypothetical protein